MSEVTSATADLQNDKPLLLTAPMAAALCGKSLRTWRTWDSAGLIPQPIRIGRSIFWRTDELLAWIAADCPRRAAWEADKRSKRQLERLGKER